ncbi:MAG: YqeG family HAD IIIA-type phosphatase [Thermoguttaceae bacterium]|jgi:HAD superfamily phosphatase (TIGR01668 family)|nr:YqeG family HAD IIIA-type phosphatase [Thermoguttaceae bacterium]
MFRLFVPDLRVDSVLDLDPQRLHAMGLDHLLVDVDCTLKRYTADVLPCEMVAWIERLGAAGIGVCLVSNGLPQRINRVAERLGVPFVSKALKPLPFRCRAAIQRLGFARKRTAMVGDQVFADVMAGRLAGLATILVRPMHPEEEPWFTRIKRPLERLLLRWLDRRQRP